MLNSIARILQGRRAVQVKRAQVAPPLGQTAGAYLRHGQSGPAIAQLQTRLRQAGFDVKVDGKFGRQTLRALRSFQRQHNCRIDGIVGPETRAAFGRAGRFEESAQSTLRTSRDRVIGNTAKPPSSNQVAANNQPKVSASRLIDENNRRRATQNPPTTTTPARPSPAPVTAQATRLNASVENTKADATHRGNMLKSWRGLKNSRNWRGKCNRFAQRAMWTAGADVKASAESIRRSKMDTALRQAREQAESKTGPGGLSRRQTRDLKRAQKRIRRRYAAKNMHNYLPPLKANGGKAHRGLTMTQLAKNIKEGKGPQLRPGMTIHVKAFPNEKAPYGSSRRGNNPVDQNHHWFTYIGKDKSGNPRFMDSRGREKTPEQCDRWLRGWMRSSVRKGSSDLGNYQAMRQRLAREGKAYQTRNGSWRAKPGVQATIEAVYSPYKD